MFKHAVFTLYFRELSNFFNNLIGTISMLVFLLIVSLFLWVFPGNYNVIDAGYANLNGLFSLAPMVFLFLVPAITMRFFAEENKSGMIEVILTRPISDLQLIVSKWLAGCTLVLLTLLPTLIYVASVSWYALPPGVDTGGTWGSYIGLFLLGCCFVAIGLFASALTSNQVISFIIGLFVCGFMLFGFELIYDFALFGPYSLNVRNLGIQAHYASMSRGVIDTRDVVYFLSLIALFFLVTKIKLESRKWVFMPGRRNILKGAGGRLFHAHLRNLAIGLVVILSLNMVGNFWFLRVDLTAEKRHSLTAATKKLLREIDDIVYFRVYLDGDFPAGFLQLRNRTREVLDEFRAYSPYIQYEFINPSKAGDRRQVDLMYDMLIDKGIQPTQIQVRADDATSQQIIFPGALVTYKGMEAGVQLLQDQLGMPAELVLNNSAQLLEYSLIRKVYQLFSGQNKNIGFLTGFGENGSGRLADIKRSLGEQYSVADVSLNSNLDRLANTSALVIANPDRPFAEAEKFVLDQYIMHGGKVLWLINPVVASMDSLQQPPHETIGMHRPLNIDDMLFTYGVRLNADLIMDLRAAPIPVTTGYLGDRPQINLIPWPYFPLASPAAKHPVTSNLNLVRTEFVSSLDTLAVDDVKKNILLVTSPYSRVVNMPAQISLSILQQNVDQTLFIAPPQAVAVLLEGNFNSVFANRILPDAALPAPYQFRERSMNTAMVIVSDGDIANSQLDQARRPMPLGYDRFTGETFGNKDFIINVINYLSDDSGIIEARTKEIRLRMLDMNLVRQNKYGIQLVNVLLPGILILCAGLVRIVLRKKFYAKYRR